MAMGVKMVSVVLGLCLLVGVVHGFAVEQPPGDDSSWRFSVRGGNPGGTDPAAKGGHVVEELNGFQVKGFGSYDAGVAGARSGDANANQFSAFPGSQSSTNDFDGNQFQESTLAGQSGTQHGSRSGDEEYAYNARFQSSGTSDFGTSGVSGVNGEPDNAVPYDYNRFSSRPEGFSAHASQFNHKPSHASYVLGVPEERVEEEAQPDYASFTNTDVQGGSADQVVQVGKSSEVEESLPAYAYDARAGSAPGREEGNPSTAGASFTTTDVQEPGAEDQAGLAKGHEGPVSYYTPSNDRDGAFVFYDAGSDEPKLDSKVDDDSAGASSFAQYNLGSSDTTTSASTSPSRAQAQDATHGCPNSYWAEHVERWPSQVKITTLVSQAFGGSTLKTSLEIIYGTTTVFQALLDTRDDPYSKLLRHAVAALLNAHAKPAFSLRPKQVARLFHAALASKAAAAAQAQKFENENHAFGDNECK